MLAQRARGRAAVALSAVLYLTLVRAVQAQLPARPGCVSSKLHAQVQCGRPGIEPPGLGPSFSRDADGDGLADAVEACLLRASTPVLKFDPAEGCPDHSGIAARIAFSPDAGVATALGVFLFHTDCGDLLGYSAHHGDSENFALRWRYCGGGRWSADKLWMAAHSGQPTDSSSVVDVRRLPITLHVAENKHGLYPSVWKCDLGGFCVGGFKTPWACSDHCGHVLLPRWSYPEMYNVGERGRRLVDDLSGAPWRLPFERVFTEMDFCGGRLIPAQRGDASKGEAAESVDRCSVKCADSLYSKLAFGPPGDHCEVVSSTRNPQRPFADRAVTRTKLADRRVPTGRERALARARGSGGGGSRTPVRK